MTRSHRPSKPGNLIYGLEDHPPRMITLVLAFQHVIILAPRLLYPVVIVQGFDGSMALAQNMVAMSMIVGGIGSILQALRKGPVGAGVLDPAGCGAAYIYPSIQAGALGGPSLIFGMTLMAGLFECVFSRLFYRLRVLFPPHVVGLVVTMVGISLVRVAVLKFVGMGPEDTVQTSAEIATGAVTLGAILAVSVWGRGSLKLYGLLFGLAMGYGVALASDLLDPLMFDHITQMDIVALPSLSFLGWSWDLSLLGLFSIAFLSTSLKTTGELITCQKINDAKWQRPDMLAVSRGLLADGATNVLAGVFGGCGQSSSSANIGLSLATAATSRRIGWVVGALLLILAFVPILPFFLAHMPQPVAGAIMVYVAVFLVVTGIQIMTTRLLDARKIYVIGVSLVFGLSVDIVPQIYSDIHHWLQPMFDSSLSLATTVALIMNLVFRLGVASRVELEVKDPGEASSERIFGFMQRSGEAWGARGDVIQRASSALNEILETLLWSRKARGAVAVEVSFDEFNLDVKISYPGEAMSFPSLAPEAGRMLEDKDCLIEMSGFLTTTWADKVRSREQQGRCWIDLHFDH